MKPGDTVRLKQDEASIRGAKDIGFSFDDTTQTFVIKNSHYNGAWIMTDGCWCYEKHLELVSEAKEPRKHSRGLRLARFAQATFEINDGYKRWTAELPKLVPRVPELRALHGLPFIRLVVANAQPNWFTNIINYSGLVFDASTGLVTKASGQKLKATKWLANVGANEAKIQELARSLDAKTFDMVLSVRFKDLLRASVSRNFTSCWNDPDITELLERPNIAIAGTKDKHGDYLSRWIVWWDTEHKRCILNPVPYPQKFAWTAAYALTDKVGIWSNYNVLDKATRFDTSNFRTKRLYDELDKGGSYIKKLSLASSHGNNENTEHLSNE